MTLSEYDHVFVINLDRRPDRMAQVSAELTRAGITGFERFAAVDGKATGRTYPIAPGHVGCVLSHLGVLRLAMERGYRNYVVFEDDAEFHPEFQRLWSEQRGEIPAGWDCVFFGGSHIKKPTPVSQHVVKMLETYTTHAMVINSTLYDKLLGVWGDGAFSAEVDVQMARLHAPNNCYSFSPPLVYQRAGYSDILDRFDDYKHLRK